METVAPPCVCVTRWTTMGCIGTESRKEKCVCIHPACMPRTKHTNNIRSKQFHLSHISQCVCTHKTFIYLCVSICFSGPSERESDSSIFSYVLRSKTRRVSKSHSHLFFEGRKRDKFFSSSSLARVFGITTSTTFNRNALIVFKLFLL